MVHNKQYHPIALFAAFALVMASPALTRLMIDGQGNVTVTSGRVLSTGSGSGGDSAESDDDDTDEQSAEQDTSGTSGSGSSQTKTEARNADGTRTETEIRQDGEVRTEVRLPDGTRIKTRAEDGRTRTDVYQGAVKVRFEREGGRFRIKAENALGQEIKLEDREDDELDEDENDVELKGILIKSGAVFQLTTNGVTYTLIPTEGLVLDNFVSQFVEVEGSPAATSPTTITVTKAKVEDEAEAEDEIVVEERADRSMVRIRALQHKVIIERLNVQALTELPLSVGLNTNILTVTTPAGEKQVTVLPDQAVQNMLAANVIDRLGGLALVEEVRQGNIQTLGQVIELGLRNNVPVYEIQGVKEHRFLGFFLVTTDVTVTVSAETGEIVDEDQSVLDAILDFFSVSA